jgi:hypothetical protein
VISRHHGVLARSGEATHLVPEKPRYGPVEEALPCCVVKIEVAVRVCRDSDDAGGP